MPTLLRVQIKITKANKIMMTIKMNLPKKISRILFLIQKVKELILANVEKIL